MILSKGYFIASSSYILFIIPKIYSLSTGLGALFSKSRRASIQTGLKALKYSDLTIRAIPCRKTAFPSPSFYTTWGAITYRGRAGIFRKPSNILRDMEAILKLVSAISLISKGRKCLTRESISIAPL